MVFPGEFLVSRKERMRLSVHLSLIFGQRPKHHFLKNGSTGPRPMKKPIDWNDFGCLHLLLYWVVEGWLGGCPWFLTKGTKHHFLENGSTGPRYRKKPIDFKDLCAWICFSSVSVLGGSGGVLQIKETSQPKKKLVQSMKKLMIMTFEKPWDWSWA